MTPNHQNEPAKAAPGGAVPIAVGVPGNPSADGGPLRDAAITFGARVGGLLLGLGIASITAWLLGTDGRGELTICLVFAQLLVMGLGFGNEMGCAYFAGSGKAPLSEVVGGQLVAYIATSATIVLAGLACIPFITQVPAETLIWSIAYAVANLFFVYMTVLAMGLGRLRQYNLAQLVSQGLTLLGLAGLWLYKKDVTLAMQAYLAGPLVAGAFVLIGLIRAGLLQRISFRWTTLKGCYAYGIRYYFGKLTTLANIQLGVIAITLIGTTDQVGLFSAALGLVARLWIVAETLNIVLLPRVLKGQAQSIDLVLRSIRATLLVTGAAALLVALVSRPLVAILLSSAFLPALGPLLILLPGVWIRCISKVLTAYFSGIDRPGLNSIMLVASLAVNFGLMVVLLPRFGLIGAAAATTTSFGVEALLGLYFLVRLSGRRWVDAVPRFSDAVQLSKTVRYRLYAAGARTVPGDVP